VFLVYFLLDKDKTENSSLVIFLQTQTLAMEAFWKIQIYFSPENIIKALPGLTFPHSHFRTV